MDKVGLVVVTYKDNFGSALQSYATQNIIQGFGFETNIFDIRGVHSSINRRKIIFYLRRVFEPDELKYLLENLKSRTRKKINIKNDRYAENMRIRHEKYVEFNKQWLSFFPTKNSWRELCQQSKQCTYVVVGSDQLWRPSNIAGGYFTLEFVSDTVNKVAYATSFGVSKLPYFQNKKAKKFLNRIKNISVREETGKKIVQQITGNKVPVVCDPTMLLDAEAWMKIQKSEPIAEEKYILCYFMGDNLQHREFVSRLRKETGCKIIGLLHGSTYIPADEELVDEAPYDVGPSEFINLIRNAEYVCTDSFHCVVFSILNSRKFFAFRRYEDSSEFSTNDRLYTLLNWTGLADRMLSGSEQVAECITHEINYDNVLTKVEEKRKESINYLRDALDVKDE